MTQYKFTLGGLQRLLEDIGAQGYEFGKYGREIPSHAFVLLRHDIDLDLKRAVVVGELEASLGVAATYLVLVSSELYNVSARSGIWAIRRLQDLGHTIGLHFDPTAHGQSLQEQAHAMNRELRQLEEVCGEQIQVVSHHKPGPGAGNLRLPSTREGLVSTYDPAYFTDIGYISDSTGYWRFSDPEDFLEKQSGRSFQMLLHPVWWSGERAQHPVCSLNSVLEDLALRNSHEVLSVCPNSESASSMDVRLWPPLVDRPH